MTKRAPKKRTERQEFEAWGKKRFPPDFDTDRMPEYYLNRVTQYMWLAWQERARRGRAS